MKKYYLIIIVLLCIFSLLAKEKSNHAPKIKPLVTFLELGAETCIPCKMMKSVMKDIQEEYKEKINVVFHDVTKDREIAKKYNIRVMPTQIFLDKDGKEFHRHEGFYPKDEIKKMIDKKLKEK